MRAIPAVVVLGLFALAGSGCAARGRVPPLPPNAPPSPLSQPAPRAVVPASITTPAYGATLPGATTEFIWTAGTGVVRYWLELGSTPGANDLFTHPNQVTVTSQIVTMLPTDGRIVYARLYSITADNAWYLVDSQYHAYGATSPPIPVTGASKVGWIQPNQTPAQTLAGITTLYVDNAGQTLTGITCSTVTKETNCVAPLPALGPGVHLLAITYRTGPGAVESARSNEISVTTATSLTPTAFGLRP
jgi:hypothetical protein